MFNRKRASSNPPRLVKTVPSAAASTAATQAFLANRNSNANLSNAAAAAALRSQTTSPVSVGQIQTKRMQRRGSVSSNGTAPDRPGLRRQGSNGSMTERTFRDPSPSRPASSHGPYARQDEPPPVPAVPKTYASPVSMPQTAARRAASVEPPERVSSPPPRLAGGRGVSLDRGPGDYKPIQGGFRAGLTSLDTVGELDRAGSRGSVNFSRPMSPTNSPPTSPLTGGRVRSPPPTNATLVSGLPSREVDRIMESIQETAGRPVKRKKKVVARENAEGSHLAAGTANGPSQEASLEATPQRRLAPITSTLSPSSTGSQPSAVTETPRPKKKKKKIIPAAGSQAQEAGEGFGSAYPSDTDSVTSERSSTTERPRSLNTRVAGMLAKQPSIVREDREAEEQEERQIPTKKTNGQVVKSGTAFAGTPANTSKTVSKERHHNMTASQQATLQESKRTSLDVPGAARPQSLSPARAAHFSSQPEYETPDGTKHQPPARSVSPAKSALKHSPSRGHSPIGVIVGGQSRRQGLASSEASDTASNISDDGSRSLPKKKKSARVSFEEDSVAVGRAASPPMSPDSPVILSPQSKPKSRSWFDLVREKNQESRLSDSDQDSVIKPTPTLPSFGSIRSRNDELALDSAEEQKSSGDRANDTLRSMDSSTDQVVGSLLSQDAATKNNKDGIRPMPYQDPQAPLPLEIKSVEGSGYHSDEESNTLEEQREFKRSATKEGAPQVSDDVISKETASTDVLPEKLAFEQPCADVPSISLQPATPALETGRSERTSWLEMPGGFPSAWEAEESSNSSAAPFPETHPEITPATVGIAEPEPEAAAAQHDAGTPHVGEVAEGLRIQIESQSGDESEDTGGSIYSDAAEDPDDLDGDGFGSINAIVESPAASPILAVTGRPPPVSPTNMVPVAKTARPSPLARNDSELSEPTSDAGWDQAQAYWSGLSQTRRQQLEQAAAPGTLDKTVIPNDSTRGPESTKKTKRKIPKLATSGAGTNDPALPPWPDKQYRNDVARPKSRKASPPKPSMRNAQADDAQTTHMRSSMRNGLPPKSALRNSGQADNTQEIHMRSSMRNGPLPKSALRNGGQRNSVQSQPEPRGALQKKNRPVSAVAMIDYNKPQASPVPAHSRAASTGTPATSLTPVLAQPKNKKPTAKPKLDRNDSDSSSSFKKARSSTSNTNSNRYSMKRTMRPSSADARPQSLSTTQSLSGRTSSPTGSMARRPFSSVGPGGSGMRTSMRDSVDSGKPARTTLRGSLDSNRPKSPSRFGFSKSSKPKPVDPKPSSRFSSRFGDSSDEEVGRPNLSSRFADSSDDEPVELTPVRGIPRRIDEGDSTDLEDSSVENVATPSKPQTNGAKAPATTKPEGLALATGSLRAASGDGPAAVMGSGLQAKKAAEKENKKRSFFASLGSKTRDSSSVRKTDTESAARGDTALARSKVETQATTPSKGGRVLGPSSPKADPISQQLPTVVSQTSTAQSSPKSPKLQRRNTPKRLSSANDISWPLAQSPGGTTGNVNNRPRTSDGQPKLVNAAAGRPDLGTRRSTVQGEGANVAGADVLMGATGKKKRFPMLRKAFGLRD
ncbi:MAG: hypothetical protein ALECFALPRED_003841 [Alectoria fallacina]|uniref:Uncharacterized protein n=1 Tax=Alectoria fallacina TaxID=1903189 RepID=A0A8H3EKX1_9LECA|nr:MAG: hypothetical protein ALECFALPRED_003841 [Alectoria fallacina]